RSHWSTSKTPSYTKSVSWQHHQECELILSNEDVQDLSDPYSESEWLSCMIIQTNTRTRQLQLYHNSEDFYPSPLTRG
ncbi:hypothetical protein SM993_14890, partial [Escherichia coli]|nr:hypothetical protein [Escherichia coli]